MCFHQEHFLQININRSIHHAPWSTSCTDFSSDWWLHNQVPAKPWILKFNLSLKHNHVLYIPFVKQIMISKITFEYIWILSRSPIFFSVKFALPCILLDRWLIKGSSSKKNQVHIHSFRMKKKGSGFEKYVRYNLRYIVTRGGSWGIDLLFILLGINKTDR